MFRFFVMIFVCVSSIQSLAQIESNPERITELSNGYLIHNISQELLKDYLAMEGNSVRVSLVHPHRAITSVVGDAHILSRTSLLIISKQRFLPLPDMINTMILLDSVDRRERRTRYRHVDNHLYWTFLPRGGNPDDLTGIPSGPQPYYCGDILCACVVGTTGEESCSGMNKVAKGGCKTDDNDIKVCCQAAGTNPVDVDGGMTTTCQ